MSNFVRNYYPQRPVKSFQDLEVYQKLLAVSVAVSKRIDPVVIAKKLVEIALNLPVLIATAHSLRFGDHGKAVLTLEEVMLDCNLLIVYLEQYRDIENTEVEPEFFEEQIRTLLTCRFKVLHLQQSWKKFDKEKEMEK